MVESIESLTEGLVAVRAKAMLRTFTGFAVPMGFQMAA